VLPRVRSAVIGSRFQVPVMIKVMFVIIWNTRGSTRRSKCSTPFSIRRGVLAPPFIFVLWEIVRSLFGVSSMLKIEEDLN
jgi:hypothetical protein